MKLLNEIAELLLGRKYYANIVNRTGTEEIGISYFIFSSREQAHRHRDELAANRSFSYICTVSFRSHKQLTDKTIDKQ